MLYRLQSWLCQQPPPCFAIRDRRRPHPATSSPNASARPSLRIARARTAGSNPRIRTLERAIAATGHQLEMHARDIRDVDETQIRAARSHPDRTLAYVSRPRTQPQRASQGRLSREFSGLTSKPTRILAALLEAEVDFVVIGGVAVVLHGSTAVHVRPRHLLRTERANITRCVRSLLAINARLRGAPAASPFRPGRADASSGCRS